MKKSRLLSMLRAACLFAALFFMPTIQAQEATYQITAAQLAALEMKLQQLSELNNQSQADLVELRKQLSTSRAALSKAISQSGELKMQLNDLKKISEEQEKSLTKLKEYCEKLERKKAPLALNEYGLKLDEQDKINGLSLGRYWKLPNKAFYLGLRGGYDWHDNKYSLWITTLN